MSPHLNCWCVLIWNGDYEHNTKLLIYDLWISPDRGIIELVIDSESKYLHLDKTKSAEVFKLITGKNLEEILKE